MAEARPPRRVAATPDTPVAVALSYQPERENAPRIVAKGQGPVAEQILAVARAHGVTVRQDQDLVGVLAALDIGKEIPVAAFAAVAEILSYVYRMNGTMPATLKS